MRLSAACADVAHARAVTVDRGRTRDALADDAGATAWLRAIGDRLTSRTGLQADRFDEAAVPVAGALRDALRRLAAEATDDPRPPATAPDLARSEAIATLNATAEVWPQLVWPEGGRPSVAYRGSGTSARLAVQLIAHQAVELFAGPDRDRLRPCLAPNCLLFFLKNTPRREWCSPACGNRVRVARHYRRHHATDNA
ncbi:CGNR zinc finger domain-containing protein [Streptomyces dubilierae]|uniref:CGNR zinc finger domain-containing protein n=1 Tax=Streptomyces dubilierae TaxID=3075533 RepID=A0ABU2P1J0_9ACTN|nr:CGNR zinc finger domain-containing protein [Streptomyces sp. DSM 41921]MDT0386006.1 CGNR zinc finger domain-containing protein [Streptomyces sp. DSM 41921]